MFQGVISGRVKFKAHKPEEHNADNIPAPNGVWLQVWPLKAVETTKGGLIMSQQDIEDEERGFTIAYVGKLGSLAYKHDKYENNPFCKEGDYVLFARHMGLDFEINGKQFKLIQDDRPLMTFTEEQLIKLDIIEKD